MRQAKIIFYKTISLLFLVSTGSGATAEYSHTCESRANELKKTFHSYSRLSPLTEYAKFIDTESIEARRWAQFKYLRFTGKAALPSSNPDFLAHAKVYVFGTRYLIDPLREKALKSLHLDLCEFHSAHKPCLTFLISWSILSKTLAGKSRIGTIPSERWSSTVSHARQSI
jgi:hypothetical protein